jgi:hypothetical protein
MNTTPRNFVTVDMRDLKVALEAQARETRRSVSDLVRAAVAEWLEKASGSPPVRAPLAAAEVATVKLSIRLSSVEAQLLASRALQAGVSRGALIGGLLSDIPLMSQTSTRPAEVLSALVSSNAQISTLARHVARLCLLLELGQGRAAREYRLQLAGLVDEVRAHLRLTAETLDSLRPRRGGDASGGRPS